MKAGSSRLVPARELRGRSRLPPCRELSPFDDRAGLILSRQKQREEICGSRVGLGGVERPS